jgi:hypothetical protein
VTEVFEHDEQIAASERLAVGEVAPESGPPQMGAQIEHFLDLFDGYVMTRDVTEVFSVPLQLVDPHDRGLASRRF